MKICPACSARFQGEIWHCPSCQASFLSNVAYIDLLNNTRDLSDEYMAGSASELAEFEENHFWFEERAQLITTFIGKYFSNAESLLEIGCGAGFVLKRIQEIYPTLQIAGADVNGQSLHEARRRLRNVPLYRFDAERIPFDSEFDIICCLDVLEHVDDDVAVLREVHRAVRPGGGLVVTVPQHPRLWSHHDVRSCHVRRYTRSELLWKLSCTGWQVIHSSSFVTFLLPMMIASRLLMRTTNDPDRTVELNPPRTINTMLRAVMRAERFFVEQGFRFPFGGSRLVIARSKE